MPVTLADINRASGAATLTTVERLYALTPVLTHESTVAAPTAADVTEALDALEATEDAVARRQSLRAHLAAYKRGMVVIDGGANAANYQPKLERWAIRNGVRLLLGMSAEPEPASSDSLQLISIPLTSYCTGDEYS